MISSAATSPTPYTLKTILKFKPFRTLWLAQFVSIFGDFLALFGVISLITFRWHGTPVQVTTVTHRIRIAHGHHQSHRRRLCGPLEREAPDDCQ